MSVEPPPADSKTTNLALIQSTPVASVAQPSAPLPNQVALVDTPPFRGPLRYEIETASSQLEAGAPFSIFVRITNPYDVPVTILGVGTLLPAEFKNPDSLRPTLWDRLMSLFVGEVKEPKSIVATAIAEHEGEAREAVPGPISLEPGNTAIKKFSVKTRQVTLFSPALYTFHIEIQYEINGKPNRDAVKQQFNIRAPMTALVYGSTWEHWLEPRFTV